MSIVDMICDAHGLEVFYVEPGKSPLGTDGVMLTNRDGKPLDPGYYYAVTERGGIIYGPCGPYPLRKPAILALLAEMMLDA